MSNNVTPEVIISTTSFFFILCVLSVLARFYERIFVQRDLWWDDWCMLLAGASTVTLCVLQLVMIKYGAGIDISQVSKEQFRDFSMLFLDLQPVARAAILFARVSILLFYLRIFFPYGIKKKTVLWWLIHITIWANVLYSVALTLATTLQCVPQGLPWGTSCIDQYMVLVVSSSINIISDIVVLVIPVGLIWRLNMKTRTKWAIWCLFMFGALAPLVSAARLGYQIPNATDHNKTKVYPTLVILATAEQIVAMIGGTLPIVAGTFMRRFRSQSSQPFRVSRRSQLRTQRRLGDRTADHFELRDSLTQGSVELLHLETIDNNHTTEPIRRLPKSYSTTNIT